MKVELLRKMHRDNKIASGGNRVVAKKKSNVLTLTD